MADDESLSSGSSKYLTEQLASLLFHRIRNYIDPLDDSRLAQNHASPDYTGPDFLHPYYTPHARFTIMSYIAQDEDDNPMKEAATLPHYHRARDFLAMVPSTWDDITTYLANVFAGFCGYNVLW